MFDNNGLTDNAVDTSLPITSSSKIHRHTKLNTLRRIVRAYAKLHCLNLIDSKNVPPLLIESLLERVTKSRDIDIRQSYKYCGELRYNVWKTLDAPEFSTLSRHTIILLMVCIVISVLSFCLETIPSQRSNSFWDKVDTASALVFTVEYALRLMSCPNQKAFLTSILNIIDLISIMPFYIEIILANENGGGSATIFRAVRLVRIFRVFKLGRYVSWLTMFVDVFKLSLLPLLMLSFVLFIGLVVLSSSMFYVEQIGSRIALNGDIYLADSHTLSPFQSILQTFYWCIVTITTVGYGDIVPSTRLGQLLASFTGICGILVLAIPISVVSQNFRLLYTRRYDIIKYTEKSRLKKKLFESGMHNEYSMYLHSLCDSVLERASASYIDIVRENIAASGDKCSGTLKQVLRDRMNGIL